jgi:Glycosyltransferase family 87
MHRSSQARTPAHWLRLGVGATVLATLLALAAYALLSYALSRELGADVSAYWNAAERLRAGDPLYAAGAANASDLYRYAPWFAAAWVPLTFLPREAVTAGWVGLMLAAALLSTLPLIRRGPAGWAALAILGPLQIEGAVFGNVQPLLVLGLLWGVERKGGPLWIALGASLKAVPLLLAFVYAGRGEWRRAGLAVGLTAVLVLPALVMDLSGYSTDPGPNQSSLAGVSLYLYLPVVAATLAASWILARTRFGWVAGAIAMVLSLPRLLEYEVGFLLVGLAGDRSGDRR